MRSADEIVEETDKIDSIGVPMLCGSPEFELLMVFFCFLLLLFLLFNSAINNTHTSL